MNPALPLPPLRADSGASRVYVADLTNPPAARRNSSKAPGFGGSHAVRDRVLVYRVPGNVSPPCGRRALAGGFVPPVPLRGAA